MLVDTWLPLCLIGPQLRHVVDYWVPLRSLEVLESPGFFVAFLRSGEVLENIRVPWNVLKFIYVELLKVVRSVVLAYCTHCTHRSL